MAPSLSEADTPTPEHPRPRRRDLFDVATFAIGMYGFLHEVLAGQSSERWGILVMSGVMMGLGKTLDVMVRILEIVSTRGGRP